MSHDASDERHSGTFTFLGTQSSISRLSAAVLLTFTIALLVVNGALLRHNAKLTRALKVAQRSLVPTVGAAVPPLVGIDLQGKMVSVDYSSGPRETFLFVFSPTCMASMGAWPYWSQLAQHVDAASARMVYINIGPMMSPTEVATFRYAPPADVLSIDAGLKVAYNLQLTPQILRITPRGTIADVWVGTLSEEQKGRLEELLAVNRVPAVSQLR